MQHFSRQLLRNSFLGAQMTFQGQSRSLETWKWYGLKDITYNFLLSIYPYPYIRLIIQLTHRNMSTKIKQMIKTKNDKKIEVQQQSQYESLYNILTINKELLM